MTIHSYSILEDEFHEIVQMIRNDVPVVCGDHCLF